MKCKKIKLKIEKAVVLILAAFACLSASGCLSPAGLLVGGVALAAHEENVQSRNNIAEAIRESGGRQLKYPSPHNDTYNTAFLEFQDVNGDDYADARELAGAGTVINLREVSTVRFCGQVNARAGETIYLEVYNPETNKLVADKREFTCPRDHELVMFAIPSSELLKYGAGPNSRAHFWTSRYRSLWSGQELFEYPVVFSK